MRFAVSSVLSFAAMASAAAVSHRAEYGYWDFTGNVNFPANGMTSYNVAATYHNAELAEPIKVTCTYRYIPGAEPTEEASCTDNSFSYDFGGVGMADTISNVTLRQTVGLWGEQVTVSGTQEFDWDFSGGSGRSGDAAGKIQVDSAVA
ncbi:hypothetical protein BS50DRAFT_621309 [Corynespora cassiicola Philippines]|uniref:AA1-like domain-containing protein n=1 Tax=Corynespora cassiicola Philippines TaxID=1448308 RepID=A0A2T2NQA3_CORCC|nr:hypothetical protein BS50DRAFT_621309 [Corynespora cassiicola Philippines]